jgi:hypothetical protein
MERKESELEPVEITFGTLFLFLYNKKAHAVHVITDISYTRFIDALKLGGRGFEIPNEIIQQYQAFS